jgi:hypothetical protein
VKPRGSRDGFEARRFHVRCDGRANTLPLILDTKGNVFGGFTPLQLDSAPLGKYKCDDSLKSFLFTPARKFALKAEEKQYTIYCGFSSFSSAFGYSDIRVYGNCNPNTESRRTR